MKNTKSFSLFSIKFPLSYFSSGWSSTRKHYLVREAVTLENSYLICLTQTAKDSCYLQAELKSAIFEQKQGFMWILPPHLTLESCNERDHFRSSMERRED